MNTNSVRILIVDDNPDDRILAQRELTREFARLEFSAPANAEALDRVLSGSPFDLVITDYQILWTDGLEILRRVKAAWPDCPVLMFTATGNEEVAVSAMKAGLEDYVIKSSRHYFRLRASVKAALNSAAERRSHREMEAKFQRLFQGVPVGLFHASADGVIRDANDAMLAIIGYASVEELGGVRCQDLFIEPDAQTTWNHLLTHDGFVRDFEAKFRKTNGDTIWVTVNIKLVHDQSGRSKWMEGAITDITLRKRMELLVRDSEERYALAEQATSDGLWDWDLRTGTIYFSHRWKEILGCESLDIGSHPGEFFDRVIPDDLRAFQKKMEAHIQGLDPHCEYELRMKHRDGSVRWVLVRSIRTDDERGLPTRVSGSISDVTERRRAEEELRKAAFYDSLTGMPNRALFSDRVMTAIRRHKRNKSYRYAVLLLDMDRFKFVNESLGHAAGDLLLAKLGRKLEASVKPGTTVARLGGDEFAVLLEGVEDETEAAYNAERIKKALLTPTEIGGRDIYVSVSIGIVIGSHEYESSDDVMRDADAAMYRAKAGGKTHYEIFDRTMQERAMAHLELESDLRYALDHDELLLHFQPVVSAGTGEVLALEGLLRWNRSTGQVSPVDFIPLAEETGFITRLTESVLIQAVRMLSAMNEQGRGHIDVAVNVSAVELMQKDFAGTLGRLLREASVDPSRLVIEITESVLMKDMDVAQRVIRDLADVGIRLAVDDFGTGYSGFGYLKHFPISILKIDRSFTTGLGIDRSAGAITDAVITLAHSLDLQVIAEGVETEEQRTILADKGCDLIQGYLISPAVAPGDVPALFSELERQHRA